MVYSINAGYAGKLLTVQLISHCSVTLLLLPLMAFLLLKLWTSSAAFKEALSAMMGNSFVSGVSSFGWLRLGNPGQRQPVHVLLCLPSLHWGVHLPWALFCTIISQSQDFGVKRKRGRPTKACPALTVQ